MSRVFKKQIPLETIEDRNVLPPSTFDEYLREHKRLAESEGRGSFWQSHSCSRCQDGAQPERCPSKSGGCEYPRAVND